jgi:hypothetical protein
MTMNWAYKAMKASRPTGAFMNLAQMMGEAAKIEKDCGNFQTAWNVMVDYLVAYANEQGARLHASNLECKSGLYNAPNYLMQYMGVWFSMNETRIVQATF